MCAKTCIVAVAANKSMYNMHTNIHSVYHFFSTSNAKIMANTNTNTTTSSKTDTRATFMQHASKLLTKQNIDALDAMLEGFDYIKRALKFDDTRIKRSTFIGFMHVIVDNYASSADMKKYKFELNIEHTFYMQGLMYYNTIVIPTADVYRHRMTSK